MLPGRSYGTQDIVRIFTSRGWIVLASLLVCTYGALVVSAWLPNVYRAETLIQVVPQRVPDSYVRSTVTLKTEDRLEALSAQVMSRTELERLINEFGLYPRERQRYPMQDVVDRMRANIAKQMVRAAPDRPVDSFYLRYTYSDAVTTAKVTERLALLFIDQNARERGVLAKATDTFLQSQLDDARKRLEEQERKLEVFREHNAGRLPTQLDFNMQAIQNAQLQLQQLTESLARDRDRRLTTEQLLKEAQAEQVVSAPIAVPANTDPAAAVAAGVTVRRHATSAGATSRRGAWLRSPAFTSSRNTVRRSSSTASPSGPTMRLTTVVKTSVPVPPVFTEMSVSSVSCERLWPIRMGRWKRRVWPANMRRGSGMAGTTPVLAGAPSALSSSGRKRGRK